MNFTSMRPAHLKRYRDIVRLIVRHGGTDLLRGEGLDLAAVDPDLEDRESRVGSPEGFAEDLESLGPTFVKLGQMLSTRPDLLPEPYREALRRLQDKLEPIPSERVAQILHDELGGSVDSLYAEFDLEPLASASLGQVHRARTSDGQRVAVKVQRPDIRQGIVDDLDAFEQVARWFDEHTDVGRRYRFGDMVDELRATLLRELDYRREARNLERWGEGLAGYDRLVVPQPIDELTTDKVLTMDFIEGRKLTDMTPEDRSRSDGPELAQELAAAYLDQILLEGFFHADPHPGNVLLARDGRLALIDLGMVARLPRDFRRRLIKLLMAVDEDDSKAAADLCISMGTRLDDGDTDGFRRAVDRLIGRFRESTLEDAQLGRVVFELARASADHGIRPAPELVLVGKTFLPLDEIGRCLDPDFSPHRVVREHIGRIARRHMLRGLSPARAFATLLELDEVVRETPRRINRLLDALDRRELELRVRAFDESRVLDSVRKVGNRIAVGLILAALIVGASLSMNVETKYTIFGYPALAMVLFLAAVGGGIALTLTILWQDWRGRD